MLVSKLIFLYFSQFHNLHVNTTAIHKLNKDPMSDMLSRHSKEVVSGSLKFQTAIEEIITVCFLCLLFD